MNSRKITASIIVNSPIDDVWSIITDYDHLATHVPNLTKSYVIPPNGNSASVAVNQAPIISISSSSKNHQSKNVRIFQEGAQKIAGFDFRASLTMDMREEEESESMNEKKLRFKLAESSMFSAFDGTWAMRYHSRVKEFDTVLNDYVFRHKTLLTYTVLVKPKGPVPVIALEWRIKEDVPINLVAMKKASEKVTANQRTKARKTTTNTERLTTNWGADETLGMYINNLKSGEKDDLGQSKKPPSMALPQVPNYYVDEVDANTMTARLYSVLSTITATSKMSVPK